MRAGRLGVCVVVAAVGVAAAYFIWPNYVGSFVPGDARGAAAKKAEGKARAPGAPVTAALAAEADMPVILFAPGTVEPLANVAVKTRVDGQIVEVLFKEGDLVNAGDVLFRLDERLVKAQIAQAEASIAKDQAGLLDAEATLARRQALIDKKVVTEAALDQARFAVEGLRASIAAGRALLESQKTQLDYLTIKAPITGRTGSLSAKLGATIRGQDSAALVTINQTKPIVVGFAVPQGELGAVRRALSSGARADIVIPGSDRSTPVQGTITFVDNQVEKQTGTIGAKVTAENLDEALWPGQSVEVALTVEIKRNVLAVPATAVLPSQQGMMAWVIGPDNKVTARTVTVMRIVGQTAYLSEGLKAGERVVTDGQIRLSPGAAVTIEEPRRPRAPVGPKAQPASEEQRMNGRG